ncbi:MAG: DUF2309 domain-containing protein [Magnetococcales bacterium]|nr:DUF2309 domain-containing protein [Magnetococcales bacterium]
MPHILPGQASIKDFVHHNTLHGYQHHSFPKALAESQRRTGTRAFLPEDRFRVLHGQGRITDQGLLHILNSEPYLAATDILFTRDGQPLRRRDVYLATLLHPCESLTEAQLVWQIEELGALERFQADLPDAARQRLLLAAGLAGSEAAAVTDLWQAALQSLGLEHAALHPEELLDLSPDQADGILHTFAEESETGNQEPLRFTPRMEREADLLLNALLHREGHDFTLRRLLLSLTGHDLLDDLRPLLVRLMANHLDLGVAAWTHPDREHGLYAVWRATAAHDLAWGLDGWSGGQDLLAGLPDDSLEAILQELERLGLPEAAWAGYLEGLALELPGWGGMFAWRQAHPRYQGSPARIDLTDYLAVRLILERLYAERLCRRLWKTAATLKGLRDYFHVHRAEFLVRYALFNIRLPEYAVLRAQALVRMAESHAPAAEDWNRIAHLIWIWRHSPAADRARGHSVYRSGWRLFRLAQHLGLDGSAVRDLTQTQIHELLGCLDQLTPDTRDFIWLRAYENHYRDQLFQAIKENHDRGLWKTREGGPPQAQVLFCMDDREEGIRRHLEEHNPNIETLGAAGFFGVAINWQALDDDTPAALCPVVVSPAHHIGETIAPAAAALAARHQQRRGLLQRVGDLLVHGTRHDPVGGAVTLALAAPVALGALVARTFLPLASGQGHQRLLAALDPPLPTRLELTAVDDGPATPERNRRGFTDIEQADRVAALLRTIGLVSGFAPLMVLMGHGSTSENNPHRAAYDCGACSGRHGGPNARVFAAMANRPQVRALLAERGIVIPPETRFLGVQHNTCDETFVWYDTDDLTPTARAQLDSLQADLDVAASRSAHERCRKLASAPVDPALPQALHHVQARSHDISQARPELGHVTNAAAFIGRRAVSHGIFFDRRAFLISYDPTLDPDGRIVESILLNAGPVGAGINLEYYFSTVANDRLGCGTKITHNVTGFFGVMDGAESDLRTGLPVQMIEIHEAMRLQMLVEAKTDLLTAIYQRQPALQELVGNGWLLLSAKDPDGPAIHLFEPKRGWIPWQGGADPLPVVERSPQWYRGLMRHLPPALIRPAGEVRP